MQPLIIDASALFNFGHRGELQDLLKQLQKCYRLVTTPDVRDELVLDPDQRAHYEKLVKDHLHLQIHKAVKLPLDKLARLTSILGKGELSMILLGLELGGDCRLAIDERTARREAAALGLTVTGTVGLLKEALDRGWRTDAECMTAVRLMVERGFWLRVPAPDQTFEAFFRTLTGDT